MIAVIIPSNYQPSDSTNFGAIWMGRTAVIGGWYHLRLRLLEVIVSPSFPLLNGYKKNKCIDIIDLEFIT